MPHVGTQQNWPWFCIILKDSSLKREERRFYCKAEQLSLMQLMIGLPTSLKRGSFFGTEDVRWKTEKRREKELREERKVKSNSKPKQDQGKQYKMKQKRHWRNANPKSKGNIEYQDEAKQYKMKRKSHLTNADHNTTLFIFPSDHSLHFILFYCNLFHSTLTLNKVAHHIDSNHWGYWEAWQGNFLKKILYAQIRQHYIN